MTEVDDVEVIIRCWQEFVSNMSTHREDDASLALAAQILEQVFKIAVAGEEDERIVRVALKDCVNRNLDIKVRLSVRSIGCVVAVFFQRLRDEPEAKPVLKGRSGTSDDFPSRIPACNSGKCSRRRIVRRSLSDSRNRRASVSLVGWMI